MLKEQRKTAPERAEIHKINIKSADAHNEDTILYRLVSILETYKSGASREWLAYYLDISDRKLRAEVEKARNLGFIICSNSDIRGYRLGDKEDALRTIAELRSRAKKLLDTADAMEETLIEQEQGHQLELMV